MTLRPLGVSTDQKLPGLPSNVPSPSYIYHSIRPSQNCKAGTQFDSALNLLKKGSLSLAAFPYVESCRIPNGSERASATDFRISSWVAIDLPALDDVKGQVARGRPVMFGMDVGEQFTNLQGSMVYRGEPNTTEGHAMTVVGYDDEKQAFKIINSWGQQWGDRGFGWISYNAFEAGAAEAYIMDVDANMPAPEPKPVAILPVPAQPVPKPKPKPVVVTPDTTPADQPPVVVPPAPVPTKVVEEPVADGDCSLVASEKKDEIQHLIGFVDTEAALERLRKDHRGPGYKIDVQVMPWPQCEVLMTLEKALRADDAPAVTTATGSLTFRNGDPMVFNVLAPRKPAYVYVSYVQADGTVVNLQQPAIPPNAPSLSGKQYAYGDGQEGRQSFKASAPYGTEMVVVLGSASPLFEERLPEKQTEREFLTALRKALIYKADPSMPDREVSAAFLGIETREK